MKKFYYDLLKDIKHERSIKIYFLLITILGSIIGIWEKYINNEFTIVTLSALILSIMFYYFIYKKVSNDYKKLKGGQL